MSASNGNVRLNINLSRTSLQRVIMNLPIAFDTGLITRKILIIRKLALEADFSLLD